MKKILVTGTNSYIGKSLNNWFVRYSEKYLIDMVSLKSDSWKEIDFSDYDVIIHLAAIVHNKEIAKNESLYYRINRDLTLELAKRAKSLGVKQFIFMSTMAVYGEEGAIGKDLIITKDTLPNPKTYYGISKLQAENEINKLIDKDFKVVVIRPPMIYGPDCPGNYTRLEKLAKKIPVFPMIENKRSMLHIDKLCADIKVFIDTNTCGLYFPQDEDYVNTSFLFKSLGEKNGKKIYLSKSIGWVIETFGKRVKIIKKIFGNLVYEK